MKSNYKRLGDYIRQVDVRNKDEKVTRLLGVSIDKKFIESIANTIGTDMSVYKIVKHRQFAYGPVTSRNGDKVSIALLLEEECIISSSYTVFEITDTKKLLPEYLNLWFKRPEFDRYARFHSHGSAREIFDWEEMCNVELPVPPIEEQEKIVNGYQKIESRIALKKKINENLENQALGLYRILVRGTDSNTPMSKIYKFQYGKGNNNPDNGGMYPIYGSNGIIGGYDLFNNIDAPIIGHIGSCGSLLFAFGKHFVTYNGIMCNCIKPIYKWFGYLTLKNQNLQEQVRGSTQPFISYDMLYEIQVPLPNEDEIFKFNYIVEPIFDSIREIELEMQCLKHIEAILLQKLSDSC